MIHSSTFSAVLDANVLYPANIRDLLLTLAWGDYSFYKPYWTNKIHEEWTRNLAANRPDINITDLQEDVALMNRIFGDSLVEEYEPFEELIVLPDPHDRHVVACAIKSNADVIVTQNTKDFPQGYLSRKFHIDIKTPDEFVLDIIDLSPPLAVEAFSSIVNRLKDPPLSHGDVLIGLEKNNMPLSVAKFRKLLGID